MDLSGRVALVTGAGSGIGRAIALAYAAAGARLALIDVDPGTAEATLAAAATPGAAGPGAAIGADVADAASVHDSIRSLVREVGPIDVVVNNAGIAGAGRALLHETAPEDWERVLAVNLTGPFLVCRAVLPSMLERRTGVFVNVASAAGLVALRGRSPYVASKAALIHLTRNLAVEYAAHGIRANALCPGYVDTPLIADRSTQPRRAAPIEDVVPMGRVAQPEEIAPAALFLASESSRYMTGQTLVVDGGWTAA